MKIKPGNRIKTKMTSVSISIDDHKRITELTKKYNLTVHELMEQLLDSIEN